MTKMNKTNDSSSPNKILMLATVGIFILFVSVIFLDRSFDDKGAEKRAKAIFKKELECNINLIDKGQRSDNEYTRRIADYYSTLLISAEMKLSKTTRIFAGYEITYDILSKDVVIRENETMRLTFYGYVGNNVTSSEVSRGEVKAACLETCNKDAPSYDRKRCYDACDFIYSTSKEADETCGTRFSFD